MPIATTGALGGVRIANGGGIFIDQNGAISTNNILTNVIAETNTGQFQVGAIAGTQLNHPLLGKLFISTVQSSLPQVANNTMVYHLEVNGSSRINGNLVTMGKTIIVEQSGTTASATNGSIILDHENSGGASSITFTSKVNRGSDFGYIQYQDASFIGNGGSITFNYWNTK